MATDSFTLAAIINDIFQSYRRDRPDIRERLPNRLAYWISQLATKYPFWFMMVEPGAIAPGLFPFSSTPSYSYLAEGIWIDQGWFTSIQGQRDYYFSAPNDPTQVLDTSQWNRLRVQTIETLYQYPLAGGPPREIQIVEYNEFLRQSNWTQSQGQPDYATLINIGPNSSLRFNRTPDSNLYIYATRFLRKDFPAFTSPSDTNPVFQYQPEFVRVLGCWIVAQEFRDDDASTSYYDQLFGAVNPATGSREGGIIPMMAQETRKRWQTQDEVLEHYTSPPTGQRQEWRKSATTGGYWPDIGWF